MAGTRLPITAPTVRGKAAADATATWVDTYTHSFARRGTLHPVAFGTLTRGL